MPRDTASRTAERTVALHTPASAAMWPMVSLHRPRRATSAAIVDRTAVSAMVKRAASCGGSQPDDVQRRRRSIASGDLGGPAYRKYDLEAWMPGRGEHGEYGEVTSTSDCTDYQARRLNIRFKPSGSKGTRFVHTLNGTAVALSRALIVVLENYQRADGLIDVPEVLKPYIGKDLIGGVARA